MIPLFQETTSGNQLPFTLHDLAAMIMEEIYLVNFHHRSFIFLAKRDFFLNGHSVDEVMKQGFDFFPELIYSKDLPLLKEIHAAILQHEQPAEINYFSFTLRLKNELAGYIMVDHKLKPIIEDGQVRFGVCMLAVSISEKPGNLEAHHHNNADFDEYDLIKKKWQMKKKPALTKQEKLALIWAKQGKTYEQIAGEMGVNHQYVKNILSRLYQKLNVHSITQAINYTNHHHLIFTHDHENSTQAEEAPAMKKQRRAMTPVKLKRIQDALDKGKSVNSIAKQENVGEWTIRYAIDTQKLKK